MSKKDIYSDFKVYPKTFHGFAVRGCPHIPEISKARQDALLESCKFFKNQFEG